MIKNLEQQKTQTFQGQIFKEYCLLTKTIAFLVALFISNCFQLEADEINVKTHRTASVSNILSILTGILAVSAFVGRGGRRLSHRIAKPILLVAGWSEQFYTGVDNLKLADTQLNKMNADAEVIQKERRRFSLRKRISGKSNIPPEKENDAEFIKQAHENYSKNSPLMETASATTPVGR